MEVSQVDNLQEYIFSGASPGAPTPPSPADSTVQSVEEGIRRAEQLLARDVLAGASRGSDRDAAVSAAVDGVPLSAGRRKQILRGLATERAEQRGYASHREAKLQAPSPDAAAGAALATPGSSYPSSRGLTRPSASGGIAPAHRPPRPPAPTHGYSIGVAPPPLPAGARSGGNRAAAGTLTTTEDLQSAAAALVNDAIARALGDGRGAAPGSESRASGVATGAAGGTTALARAAHALTASAPPAAYQALGTGALVAATTATTTATPLPATTATGSAATGAANNKYKDRAAREQLIEQLLQERRERLASSGSATQATAAAGSRGVTGATAHAHTHQHKYVPGGASGTSFDSPGGSHGSWSASRLSRPSDARLHDGGAAGGDDGGVPRQGETSASTGDSSSPGAASTDASADDAEVEPLMRWDADSLEGDASDDDGDDDDDDGERGDAGAGGGRERGSRGGGGGGRKGEAWGTGRPRKSSTKANDGGSRSRNAEQRSAAARAASRKRLFARRSLEDLKRKQEEREMAECTFKPRINKRFGSSRRRPASREQRLRQLSESRNRKIEARLKAKAQQEEAEAKECTFAPSINPTSRAVLRHRASGNITERLHKEADRRATQRAKAQQESEEQAVAEFPFRPVINSDTHAILDLRRYRPIHERVGDLQRAKNEHLLQLRLAQQAEDPDLTFKPRICAESEKLAVARQAEEGEAGQTVTERLSREAAARQRAKAMRQQAWQAKVAADFKFKPQINANSNRMVSDKPEYKRDFVTRQELLRQEQERQFDAVVERVEAETNQCTFKPSIGNANEVLVHTRPSRLGENEADVVDRLSRQDRKRIERHREEMEQRYYSQFKFKPKLNPHSRQIGTALSVEEHTSNRRRKAAVAKVKAEVDAQQMKECTFRPKTTKTPPSIQRYREEEGGGAQRFQLNLRDHPEQVTAQIAEYQRQRKKKLQATRRALEYEKLKDCTFVPETNAGVPSTQAGDGRVEVRGLGRYLERKAMAKKLEEEKKQREEEAFKVRGVPATVPTIPKPFHLATATHSEARARRQATEQEARMAQQCTFKPRTMESEKRALIQRLLREEEEAEAMARVQALRQQARDDSGARAGRGARAQR